MLTFNRLHRPLVLVQAVLLHLCLLAGQAQAAQPSSPSFAVRAVSKEVCLAIQAQQRVSAVAGLACEQLRVVQFWYRDFDGKVHKDGQIMVMAAVAEQVQALFDTLLQRRFPLARARLIHHYHGDDDASMEDNNTSAFNHRLIKDGHKLSLHAYGVAIDINPVHNPFLQRAADGALQIHPPAGQAYLQRPGTFEAKQASRGMAEEVVEVLAHHGFTHWGGDWRNPIDYQHFQVHRRLAEKMAGLPLPQAREVFTASIQYYRDCRRRNQGEPRASRLACVRQMEQAMGLVP